MSKHIVIFDKLAKIISAHQHELSCFCFPQITGNVTVDSASATLAGKETTVTAPPARTLVCPAQGCCAAAGVTASAGFVSALNPVPSETPVTGAPPALTPAQ